MDGLAVAQRNYDRQAPDDFEITGTDWTDADQRDLDSDMADERSTRSDAQ